jgi:two-component system, cell cycle sensor histidine kinase and response regulator CckA
MTTQNLKRKKKNNNLSDRKRTRPSKDPVIIKPFSAKRVEEEIKTLKQQMEFILGVTKTGLDIIDSEFNIRYIDPEWAKVYGNPTGKKCYEYFMDRSEACLDCGIPIALKTNSIAVTEETLVKEGNRPIQVTTIPFQNSEGEWLVAEVNVDISERKRTEGALRKAHEELEIRIQERTTELMKVVEALQDEMAERKRAEESLREGERFLSSIFTSIQDGLSILDNEFNIVRVNPTMERWYSHAMPLVGKKCYEAYHGRSQRCEVCPTYQTINTGKGAYEVVPKAGARGEIVGWLDLYSFPLIDKVTGKMRGFIEYVRDISDRKQAEEALRFSEEMAKRLAQENAIMAEIGRIISSTLDIEEGYERFAEEAHKLIPFDGIAINIINYKEGTVTVPYVSGIAVPGCQPGDILPLVGSVTGEVMRTHSGLIIQTEDKNELQARFPTLLTAFDTGLRSVIAVPLISKDQVIGAIHFRSSKPNAYSDQDLKLAKNIGSQIAGAVANAQLFTEHRRAEEMLSESEEKYRTILENIEDGYYEVDLPGNFIFFNDPVCRLFGYSKDELMGMNDRRYSDQENAKKLYQTFNKVYKTGEPTKGFDWEIIRKDGTKRYIEASVSLVKNPSGQPIGFRGIVRDITERKQAEEALRTEKQRFQTLSEQAPFGTVMIDQDGTFRYMNPKFRELFGYDLTDVPDGKTWFRKAYPDPTYRHQVISDWVNDLESSKPGEKRSRVFTASCKDGTEKIVNFISVQLERGEHLMACDDITERKQAEEALRQSEERYRTILENIEDGYYEVDLPGNFTFFNDSLCRMLGYSRDEMIGMGNQQYTDQENRKKLFQAFNEVYRTGEPTKEFDWEVFRKDGTKVFGEISVSLIKDSKGKPIGFRGIARDITERKRAEEALRNSEERFRIAAKSSSDLIWDWGILDGNLEWFGNIDERLGYNPGEFPRTIDAWEKIIHPDEHDRVMTALDQHLKMHKPYMEEYRVQRKDGTFCYWTDRGTAFWDEKGNPFKMIGACEDITERKRAEEENTVLQEQLRQSQKMEAVGRLGGGIAHDFNNLLTVIKGYSQLSLLDLKESDPLWGNIQEIQKATQRAADLTRQLLAFSRRQILDLKVLDLNALLKDLDKMLRRIIGEDIELITLLAGDLGRVKIDPGQIEQVILNLAVNSRDAMPSGGKLTIETANVVLDEEYAHAHVAVIPGHYVRLSISDTGVGMPRELKEKVFEPFFTTKEKGKGTGLGLSMVYGIVKQIGGNIWVYSEPGHGTTFKIYLPRVEEQLDTFDALDETDSFPRGGETVLLVEDDPSVQDLALRLLRQQGYTVLEAANGVAALHVAQEHGGEKIHLLLTDVVMPQMGGKELADQLKIFRPDVKVLYTSGYTDDAIVHHGVLEPGTHFLQKPFSLKTLSHKVREVLDR